MARRLGIPVRTWYNYEAGVTVPAEVILKIIELTAIEPSWLLHGKGPKFRQGIPERRESGTPPAMTVGALLRDGAAAPRGPGPGRVAGVGLGRRGDHAAPGLHRWEPRRRPPQGESAEDLDAGERRGLACGPRARCQPGRPVGVARRPARGPLHRRRRRCHGAGRGRRRVRRLFLPRRKAPTSSTTSWSSPGSRASRRSAGSSIADAMPCSVPRTPIPMPQQHSSTSRNMTIRPVSDASSGSTRPIDRGVAPAGPIGQVDLDPSRRHALPAQELARARQHEDLAVADPAGPAWPTIALMAAGTAASWTKTQSSTLGTNEVLYSLPRY